LFRDSDHAIFVTDYGQSLLLDRKDRVYLKANRFVHVWLGDELLTSRSSFRTLDSNSDATIVREALTKFLNLDPRPKSKEKPNCDQVFLDIYHCIVHTTGCFKYLIATLLDVCAKHFANEIHKEDYSVDAILI
jgi:hypothetical protein